VRDRVGGFQGIVDNDHVGAAPRENPADGGRQPEAAFGGDEFLQGGALGRQACWKSRSIPARLHQRAAVPDEYVRQVLRVSRANDRGVGRMIARFERAFAVQDGFASAHILVPPHSALASIANM
jgi:hypothetical protein